MRSLFSFLRIENKLRIQGNKGRRRRLIELLALFLYAELVFYAEKGKQAPHTREGITTGGALLRIGRDNNRCFLYAPKGYSLRIG